MTAPAASGSKERNVRARLFVRGVIGWQFYSGGRGLVNLEMQRGRPSSVHSYRGERIETAQEDRIETAFFFVVNKVGFFAFARLYRIQMAPCGSLHWRGELRR